MPHRTPLGVLRGDKKRGDFSEPSSSNDVSGQWSDVPLKIASLKEYVDVADDVDAHRPISDNLPNDIDGELSFARAESSDQSENLAGGGLRLLKSDASEQMLWRQAWDEVMSELEKMLPPEFQPIETLDTLDQVQKVHEEAQKRAEDAKKTERRMPHTNKTYRQVFGKVASCAHKFRMFGDGVLQAEPIYAALPWALIRFIIQCAVGEDEAYHAMLSGAVLVADLVSQYPALELLYAKIDSELSRKLRKSLVSFYKSVLRFQVYAINYFGPHNKVKRAIIGLNPITAADIEHRRQEMDDLRRRVDGDAAFVSFEFAKTGIDNLQVSQEGQETQLEAIKDGIRALAGNTGQAFRSQSEEQEERNKVLITMWKEPLDDLMTELENREIEKARMNLHNVRKWLSSAMPWDDLLAAKETRRMPLGNWLLNHPKFQHWQYSERSSMLFMVGFAGTGKTGLVCRVIDQLEASSHQTRRVAFFFCSNDKTDTGSKEAFSSLDPEEALRSIVSQLATSQEGNHVAPALQSKYSSFGPDSDHSMKLGYSDCIEILVMISERTPITIVLDAFDECDQSRSPRLVQHLREVIQRSPVNVKVFISTRAFPAIEDDLTQDRSIEVTAANNGSDVKLFVHSMLEDRIQNRKLLNGDVPEDLKDEIEATLTVRANNMFLYASLMLNQLCERNYDDAVSIRKKLGSLPQDLTDLYGHILAEIHDDSSNSERSCRIAQNTFKWLLCAREALQCDALLEAISSTDRITKHEEVIRCCRTLVVKGRNSYEFAHYSVREHIVQMVEYSPSQCHLVATRSCLTMLDNSFGTKKPRKGFSEAQKLFEQYALLYWPLHYEGINQKDMRDHRTAINSLLRSLLLQDRSHRNKYLEWYGEVRQKEKQLKDNEYLASKLSSLQATPLNPLFAACVFGLEDLIAKFGRELDGLNKLNDHGQSALCLAIENDKLNVVKALLSRRFPADPNLLNLKAIEQWEEWDNAPHNVTLYASAMQCAAATGRLEIAEYLIEHGAHIDLVAGYYGSPLQAAALKGHVLVVELLLRKGAEPNSQGGFYGNALQAAAAAGHSMIINLLLENKRPALVDTIGGHYGSALRAAVYSGNSDAVWALLEEKANPNKKIKDYGWLLEEAVSMGSTHTDIVRDLINAGAEADLSSKGDGIHIIHQAAMFGMIDVVQYGLNQGCRIDMVTTQGPEYHRRFGEFSEEMSPLGYACAEGHSNIVDLLLLHNASFEEHKSRSAVLWTAAYQGHADVVDLLLRRFKETHSLQETAQFLLQRPTPKSGYPVLFAGASSGKANVVKALLDHGAIYSSSWFNATPLFASATFGCPDVTELLLDYDSRNVIDVCIDQQANNGRTALYEACSMKQPVVAAILLDAGADYRIAENNNHTPLEVSCYKGLYRIVSTIIEKASENLERTEFLNYLNIQPHTLSNTALMACAQWDHLSCLNLLLDHGADYTVRGKSNYTALHLSSRHDNPAIMAALVGKAVKDLNRQQFLDFLDTKRSNGKTAMVACAERNRLEAAAILLRYGADYRMSSKSGRTPLHWACTGGHENLVIILLKQAKSDDSESTPFSDYINRVNNEGTTALMEASAKNHLSAVKVLLSYGADCVMPRLSGGLEGATALHDACRNGSTEVATHLLDVSQQLDPLRFKQFINARNNIGQTPLHDAAKTGQLLIAKVLLTEYGADYTLPNDKDVTPLHTASRKGRTEVVSALLTFASQEQNRARFTSFLDYQNKWGKTALVGACETGEANIVRLLLDHGADYTIGDRTGLTALHYCASHDRIDCARVLLESASQDPRPARFCEFLNRQCLTNGASALHEIARQGNCELAELILKYNPVYDTLDSRQCTVLHLAGLSLVGEVSVAQLVELMVEYAGRDSNKERLKRFVNAVDKNGDTASRVLSKRLRGNCVLDVLQTTGVLET